MRRALAIALSSLLLACTDTGRERVAIPLFVAGVAQSDESLWVERADLAFGPLYLCAGVRAGHLCETARLEWVDSAVVRAADASAVAVGELNGVSGAVRSFMYDLGISSLLTRPEPLVLSAAAELGGYSLRIEGRAEALGIEVPFSAAVAVQQTEETEIGVPVVRSSSGERFEHQVDGDEPGLLLRFDPRAFLEGVDFAAYLEDASCQPDGPERVCAGALEHTCEPDGRIFETRDCSALGGVCVAGAGCRERIVIEPDSQAFRSIRNALVAGRRPDFVWGHEATSTP